MRYLAKEGDTLEMICFKEYKSLETNLYALFLRANAHLLHKKTLQAGDLVNLPDLAIDYNNDEVQYLWS